MILRLKSSWIFINLWLMHIKVCYALELQRYPDGVTAIDANDKCGASGLENDPLVLTRMSQLHGHEFWTGLGKFIQFTRWIETLGCFPLTKEPSTKKIVTSVGLCQRECSTNGYFSYNKEDSACSCLNNNDVQFTNATNLSSCLQKPTKAALVYQVYNGTTIRSGTNNGLCTTLTCTPPNVVHVKATSCKGDNSIKGLCEDGMQSTSKFWGLQQNKTFENCWIKDKLLLHSNACQQFAENLTSPAWTNVFREEIEVERTLVDTTSVPKFCQSANISDNKGEKMLDIHWQKCSIKLEWLVCKNDTSTVENTYHMEVATDANYGAIVGGSVGVVIVLLIGVTVILCKVRLIGIFKSNNSANMATIVFTKSVRDDKTNLGVQTKQQVHESYGLVNQVPEKNNKTNDLYTHVQKGKRTEDTYTESSNGEYDHLHNFGERKPKAGENTYDSNAGVRNCNDPTYDTATSSTRVDMDNTYDHSFSKLKAYSEYDVSDSCMQIDRTNYSV